MTASRGTEITPRGRLTGERFYKPQQVRGELHSVNPADPSDVLATFAYGEEDVGEAVVSASRAARPWGQLTVGQRLSALDALRPELIRCAPQLTSTLVRETGRPPWECQREVSGLLSRIDQLMSEAPRLLADRTFGDLPARVLSVPLGVVAVVGPAMLPLSTSHTHIIAALIAGNSVVWKPSPHCPATAQLYAEVMHVAGLPPGVFNLIQGDDAVGRELALHPQVDAVVFTGSTQAGQELRRSLVDRPEVRLILHQGAKNAAVVLEDADLELAAYEVLVSAFQSAGQRCTATSRVLVHRTVIDEFTARLLDLMAGICVGAPGKEVFMGPILSEARLARFIAALDQAKDQGAEPLRRGQRLELPGWFVAPSLHLVHRRDAASAYQTQEHFGPDLALYSVADVDDALQLCDAGPYGLCASLFTDSPLRWRRFSEEVRAGSLMWNRGTGSPSGRLPFGGEKHSGYGGRGGADAIAVLRREVSLLGRTSTTLETFPGLVRTTESQKNKGSEVAQ